VIVDVYDLRRRSETRPQWSIAEWLRVLVRSYRPLT